MQVHIWWGDDRFVPRDHPLSNVRPSTTIVLDAADGEEGTAHSDDDRERVRVDPDRQRPSVPDRRGDRRRAGADACAAALAAELRWPRPAERDGWPVFDLMLLGIGGDGHVLSVFPGSAAFDSTRWRSRSRPRPTSSRTSRGSR